MTTSARGADAAQQLESLVLKQLLKASGAFKSSESAGASLHTDLFVEALADAVSRSGGLGLQRELARALGTDPGAAARPGSAVHSHLPPTTPGARAAAALSTVDALDGPGPLAAPAQLTSGFGPRPDPFDGHTAMHGGVDLAAPEGTEVRAVRGGVVRSAGTRGGYGLAVEVDHGDGTRTLYGHASALLVSEGQEVQSGQPIARVGHTGRATGDHLHFEVRRGGVPVDPGTALKTYGQRADSTDGRVPDAPSGSAT